MNKKIDFVKNFFTIVIFVSMILILSGIVFFTFKPNLGIDFAGGIELQVKFDKKINIKKIKKILKENNLMKIEIQLYGKDNKEILIRIDDKFFKKFDQKKIILLIKKKILFIENKFFFNFIEFSKNKIDMKIPITYNTARLKYVLSNILNFDSNYQIRNVLLVKNDLINIKLKHYNLVLEGASGKMQKILIKNFKKIDIRKIEQVDAKVSKQLISNGITSIVLALLFMLLYISFRFDLYFSPGAIIALIHDTFGVMLLFILFKYEFNLSSVAALLAIVGYSINNTIIIYDRIRKMIKYLDKKSIDKQKLKDIINEAINSTLNRTINTSLTTLFASVSLFVFGGNIIRSFSFILCFGVLLGAFSSTYIAPSIYYYLMKFKKMKINKESNFFKRKNKEVGII
jgi:preprotein translocase SecF subunit